MVSAVLSGAVYGTLVGRIILRYDLFFLSSFGTILPKSKITQDDPSGCRNSPNYGSW